MSEPQPAAIERFDGPISEEEYAVLRARWEATHANASHRIIRYVSVPTSLEVGTELTWWRRLRLRLAAWIAP